MRFTSYNSISSFIFALLALVVLSFPAHANTVAVGVSCLACNNTAEMPPGAVSAMAGTKIMKAVSNTTNHNSNIMGSSTTNPNSAGGSDGVPGDTLVAATDHNQRAYFAFCQNLILDYRLRNYS